MNSKKSARLAAALGAYGRQLVRVNYDMNDYLPEESLSTQALNKMDEAFDGAIPNARVAVKNVTYAQALNTKRRSKRSRESRPLPGWSHFWCCLPCRDFYI